MAAQNIKLSEYSVDTGVLIERELTAEEISEREAKAVRDANLKAAEDALSASKATAKAALLKRLGITADEAALLLGGNQ